MLRPNLYLFLVFISYIALTDNCRDLRRLKRGINLDGIASLKHSTAEREQPSVLWEKEGSTHVHMRMVKDSSRNSAIHRKQDRKR
ncbi:hypothetical protein DFP73DRAFT_547038 [Morchella snyderi]|nr:hypothetical protein DFP73DRAFT_547038 [Morchella snyderi]